MNLDRSQAAPRRRAALLGLAAAALLAGCRSEPTPVPSVSLQTARTEHEAGRAILIDIRESSEHAGGVAAGARLLPMSQLAARVAEIPTGTGQPVLLICHTQNRSSAALRALREREGFGHVSFVEGGMSEWARRGWPMAAPPR
jgi:rhodanese-related sulfurtransferase